MTMRNKNVLIEFPHDNFFTVIEEVHAVVTVRDAKHTNFVEVGIFFTFEKQTDDYITIIFRRPYELSFHIRSEFFSTSSLPF